MDNIFATKFGLSDVQRNLDTSYHKVDNDPFSESSHQLTDFYDYHREDLQHHKSQ